MPEAASSMPRIHPIRTGTVAVKERQLRGRGPGRARVLVTMLDRRWSQDLPVLAWLVEHPEGLILVDTGETAAVARPGYYPAWQPYFRVAVRTRVATEEEVGPQIEALGFSTADVRWVVLTHLHGDHTGGLGYFPRSRILVTAAELAVAGGTMGKLRGYLPHRLPGWFDPTPVEFDDRPLGPFPRSVALTGAGDVSLVATPGHTPGHMSVAVESAERLVLLAGDTSYTQELMLDGTADGVTDDPATARRTLGLVRDLANARPTVYLPSHDPDAVRRLAAGETARARP